MTVKQYDMKKKEKVISIRVDDKFKSKVQDAANKRFDGNKSHLIISLLQEYLNTTI